MTSSFETTRWDRNLLWMTPPLVEAVHQTHLVVIGCGGNGIAFIINAVHLGFRQFTLCDPDTLDETNLNRCPIALPDQVGQPKVEVIQSYLTARFPEFVVDCIPEAFPNERILPALSSATQVVSCLDLVHTRIEADVLCRKLGRGLIDLGSGFVLGATTGTPIAAGGQVLLSRPDGPCLMCLGFAGDVGGGNTYFAPLTDRPEPSSLVLNSVVAALGVECLLKELPDQDWGVNRVAYERNTLSCTTEVLPSRPDCRICGLGAEEDILSVTEGEQLGQLLTEEGIACKTA